MLELDFVRRLAVRAGDFLSRQLGKRRRIGYKVQRNNLVTDMDHASEKMIVSAIQKKFPGHAVLAEEGGAYGDSPHRWYVDPLDGTVNYAHGFPIYSVSIAYEREGRLEAAAVYGPNVRELFWASRGGGAFRNGRRIRVSRTSRLSQALVCTGFPYHFAGRRRQLRYFEAFIERSRAVRRPGCASLDLCWTACGVFDGFWEIRMGMWDIAAGALVAAEAGATVTDLSGTPGFLKKREVLVANPKLHPRMLAVFPKVRV